MTTFAVLATGPSLTPALVARVRGRCGVVAVSDAYRLAPWADALVSQDRAWWKHHVEAHGFAGRKFIGPHREMLKIDGLDQVEADGGIVSATNSGLLGCHVAVKHLGATRILLCGFDMRGSHFFGPHPAPLKNTTADRFRVMREQFTRWKPRGIEVVNCTPGSGLTCYPMMELEDALACLAEPAAHAA